MATRPYGNNILITGASSGIGLACALFFARYGYHVWGVSRSGACERVLPDLVHLSSMDVTDDQSVAEGTHRIWEEAVYMTGDGIGTVIHCAGFGIGGSAEDTPLEAVYSQFETNYFGVLRVNGNLLPLMRSRGPSLVIVLGSVAGKIGIPFQSHYSSTKFALEAYIEALRMEGKALGIRATVIEAGDTSTPFTQRRNKVIHERSVYRDSASRALETMERDEQRGYSADTVAKVVFKTAQSTHPPVRRCVGTSYALLLVLKRLLPDRIVESILMHKYHV